MRYIFAADNVSLFSFRFSCWVSKNASFLQHIMRWPFKVIQSRRFLTCNRKCVSNLIL